MQLPNSTRIIDKYLALVLLHLQRKLGFYAIHGLFSCEFAIPCHQPLDLLLLIREIHQHDWLAEEFKNFCFEEEWSVEHNFLATLDEPMVADAL